MGTAVARGVGVHAEVQCGTYSGYQKHKKLGEDSCEPCNVARRTYMTRWRDEHPSYMSDYERARSPRVRAAPTVKAATSAKCTTRYGITYLQREQIFEWQDRLCGACATSQTGDREHQWQVDHCHRRLVVRGILCARCNRLIGQMGDDAPSVASALTWFLSYLHGSGDGLTEDEVEEVCAAIRSRRPCNLERGVGSDRPARPRHVKGTQQRGRPRKHET